jgi:N-acetylglucosaminyldiphosphoundecaprenol N-acetyl-beta-D-mannosaminyltransferase
MIDPNALSIDLPAGFGRVTPRSADEVVDWILSDKSEQPRIVANLNMHALSVARSSPEFRLYTERADLCLIDGMPILLLARMASRRWLPTSYRVGSTDWLQTLIDRNPDIQVVAVGGSPSAALKAANSIVRQADRLAWRSYDGFNFNQQSGPKASLEEAVLGADLVLVGMGMPRQETELLRLVKLGSTAVFANVGGCLDYFAGEQALAPRWIGRIGLEWMYRLLHDPRRLSQRYLLEPFSLALALLSEAWSSAKVQRKNGC